MELTTIGSIAIVLVFAYSLGRADKEEALEGINIEDEEGVEQEDETTGRTVMMSCQTCRKLKKHREIKKDLYQCTKCKRHVDLR